MIPTLLEWLSGRQMCDVQQVENNSHRLKVTPMNRSYRDGWAEIFGDRDDTHRSTSDDDEFNYVVPEKLT